MRNLPLMIIVGFAIFLLSLGGCEDKATEGGFEYAEATITHMGFDFSVGDTSSTGYDGETILWQPGGEAHPDYPKFDRYLWWRNSHLDAPDYQNQTKDMGAVDISSVAAAPAAWDEVPLIPPLLVGHTVVARCRDGYVKFQVVSTDTSGFWPVDVRYYYSTSSTFEH